MKEEKASEEMSKEMKERQLRREIRDYAVRKFKGKSLVLPYNGKTVLAISVVIANETEIKAIKERASKLNIRFDANGNSLRFEANSSGDFSSLFYHFEY